MSGTVYASPGTRDARPTSIQLLKNIKAHERELKDLLGVMNSEYCSRDAVYRYYHHSFKVFFNVQPMTEQIVAMLAKLAPDGTTFDKDFTEILQAGTGKTFDRSMNAEWSKHARPVIEAFFHAKFFLEMAVECSWFDAPPASLPSGWAALLTLFGVR